MAILGKFGIAGAVDKILSAGDLDSPQAESAMQKLQDHKKEAVEKIIKTIHSGPRLHYTTAVQLLGQLLDNSTVELVMKELPEFDANIQSDITALLNRTKSYDPHLLLPYLKHPLSKQVSRDLIMAHRKEFVSSRLLRAVARVQTEMWSTIFELIHAQADDAAFPEAVALTKSKNPTLREYATGLIAEYNNPAAIETLQIMLRDDDKKVQLAALRGLTRIRASLPASLIFRMTQHMTKEEAPLVKALLGFCKDPELSNHLFKTIFGKNPKLRTLAINSLAIIADRKNIRELFEELLNQHENMQAMVLQELIQATGQKLIDILEVLADDPDFRIQEIAMLAVQMSNPEEPKILTIMRQHIGDNLPPDMKTSFIKRLGKAKDKYSVDALVSVMNQDKAQRIPALMALEQIADMKVLADVFEMLNNDDPEVQAVTLSCLKAIIPEKLAGKIRERLIENAEMLDKQVLPNLVDLLEHITSKYKLLETTAYQRAIDDLKKGPTNEVEMLMPESFGIDVEAYTGGDSAASANPFGNDLANPFADTAQDAPGIGDSGASGSADMSQNTAPLEKQDTELNLEQGQVLANRYKLVKEIGRGGYGSVWLVEDNFIKEQLVMKFLHQSLVSDEVAVERFVRELRLARKITHTNIIRLFDYLDLGPVAAISMEYFPGQALSSIVHQGAMEPTRVIKLIKAISGALDVAHQADVIHRDMKPANILVDEKDNIKIVDFGIAAASKHAESRLTRTGTLVGTPTYISPEQIQGKVVDGRTDLYSLGVIMYEMLAGQPPYQAEDPMALVFMHVEGNARRVEEINPVIPKDLADIVHKCIAPDPNSRYQSMAELAQALSEVQLA
jgi:serine/threonine-protein kinase